MARRKGISNKSKSITSARKIHQQGNKTPQSKPLLGNEKRVPIKSPPVIHQQGNRMAPTQVPLSSPAPAAMTCTDNNNTADLQNKYLHKKFKRASAAPVVQEPSPITSADSGQNSGREPVSALEVSASSVGQSGRHVCPYCKLACAKPSVLQKHIRAHTNERPYPCEPCGFAFKTKSNLYKHRRSRAHYQRSRGGSGTGEEDASDADLSSSNASEGAPETPPPAAIVSTAVAPVTSITPAIISTTATTAKTPIYKPKFHKAALYRDENEVVQQLRSTVEQVTYINSAPSVTSTPNQVSTEADSLTRRISKIISQNEKIVDVVEPPLLQRKYGKVNMTNNSVPVVSKLANALLRNDQQPLNLTKPANVNTEPHRERMRQRRYSETQPNNIRLDQHPQNPEGSIIKDLLLKARARGDAPFMLGDIPEDLGIGGGSQYTCPLCRISFRGADNLETHRQYYCKGEINSAVSFQRSRSVNVQLPEYYNPNTLAKLASSTLKAPANNRRGQKPGDLKIVPHEFVPEVARVSAPLPSPGPLLGNTRLVANNGAPPTKRPRSEIVVVPTLRSLEDLCSSPLLRSQQQLGATASSLQMFGGEVRIVDDASGETKTLRIEPSSAQNSPASVIFTPTSSGPETPGRIVVRSGLHSGGTMLHNPPSSLHMSPLTPLTPSKKQQGPITPHQPNVSAPDVAPNITHFRFPPIQIPQECNSSTPQTIVHGGRLIPFVPGIPGPNTLNVNEYNAAGLIRSPSSSPRLTKTSSPQLGTSLTSSFSKNSTSSNNISSSSNLTTSVINLSIPIIKSDSPKSEPNYYNSMINNHPGTQNGFSNMVNHYENKNIEIMVSSNVQIESSKELPSIINIADRPKVNGECSINFPRVTDNESKMINVNTKIDIPISISEERHFNFENLISKSEILNKSVAEVPNKRIPNEENVIVKSFIISACSNLSSNIQTNARTMETAYFKKNMHSSGNVMESGKSKFLRPSSLPLKPGTFTPKKHHGITPNAHTLPLISPETPRPAKAFGQLYLNGHAYTYLGLKCSTKAYYCTLNRLQPMYVANQHTLSMYSNWRICSEACPNPLKMTPIEAMALYDSRHRPQRVTIAKTKAVDILTHSSYWLDKNTIIIENTNNSGIVSKITDINNDSDEIDQKQSELNLTEGFESNEEYTYVRGRGRGKYVCSKCGIRCKKPSMLKKHARTHTDVRPFTCKHCAFSFKTKGNLTKHMKSKAHYKKCVELGIKPIPTSVEEDDYVEPAGGSCESMGVSGESDSETDTDPDEGNEGETESSDTDESKSRLPEHEAAHCLLSLSSGIISEKQKSNITPGLVSSNRPCTYPYGQQKIEPGERNEKVTAEKGVNITSRNLSQLAKSQPIITTTNEKLILHNDSNQRGNNEKIDDTAGANVSSQILLKYTKNSNLIRQNSVIIPNQQSVNNIYYKPLIDGFQPIDLTKPRDKIDIKVKPSIRNVNPFQNEAENEPMKIITNLVTSGNKFPKQNNEKVSDEIMFQAYLTEKALQETKIKQSQYTNNRFQATGLNYNSDEMHIKRIPRYIETVNNVSTVSSLVSPMCSASTNPIKGYPLSRESIVGCRKLTGISESHLITISNIEKSGMDTLAEIAACSSKLETNIDSNTNALLDSSNNTKGATDNAKIVASEYLKITSEKSKNNELFEDKNEIGTSKLEMLDMTQQNDAPDSNEQSDQKQLSDHMPARKVVVGAGGLSFKLTGSPNEFVASPGNQFQAGRVTEDGRSVCFICSKTFSKPSQLRLHINIHYFERPFRCEACAVSFRTKGHLQKHERSVSHHNKVSMASTFGAPTTSNPRPFNCSDCDIGFRIHGHLAKHLRSKMHVMKLECLGKLPFGTYAEIERAGVSLTDIDTTDCDNSLASLQILAQKLHEKDPSKQGAWNPSTMAPPLLPAGGESDSEGEPMSPQNNSTEEYLKNSLKTIDNINNCNVCRCSFETMKELEVHIYTEHNSQGIETFKSDIKRKCDEIDLCGKVIENKRCKVNDS